MRILNKNVLKDIKNKIPIKLHLGAGEKRLDGYYNVDFVDLPGIDIIADLNKPFDLIPANSVNEIYSRHTLEHVENFFGLIGEIHRVCQEGAKITIIVPHFSNPYYYSDPTHVRTFGLYTFNYFIDYQNQPEVRKVPSFYSDFRFKLKEVKIDFYRRSYLERLLVPLISKIVNSSFRIQNYYERRWSWMLPAWQITYVMTPAKKGNNV